MYFFFQAEAAIGKKLVTGVQTCALPICFPPPCSWNSLRPPTRARASLKSAGEGNSRSTAAGNTLMRSRLLDQGLREIGRAAGRERVEISGVAVSLKKKNTIAKA